MDVDLIVRLALADKFTPEEATVDGLRHDFLGDCPDANQPDARDPECPACQRLVALRGGRST